MISDQDAVRSFAALAQDTRLAIYRQLVEAGPSGLSAGALAEALAVPAPTLSFHLAQLRGAGLITQQRSSRSLIYAVDITRMNGVIAFLSDRCCSGRPELCLPTSAIRTKTDARPRRKTV
ncbi:winged helix-turn-helix transcriptional regulator [Ferrovibrio terrae]|uniref:Winged helix-turn-helix transcriptional regulator n=1 Tax=Ferrovibrio terrae TaxID=2594003 RepID=A0A516H438_9PROT|nr:metalloregulator ArsR/SmtB family transcription factor [Ferrovibrio terrae]QDO98543.1 winged helix-turn-helix transcriptional regulator [Ferrovibrio terrae]